MYYDTVCEQITIADQTTISVHCNYWTKNQNSKSVSIAQNIKGVSSFKFVDVWNLSSDKGWWLIDMIIL